MFDNKSLIGEQIGTVTVIRELGRGRKGVVFTGFQKTLKRNVAIKILPKMYVTSPQEQQQFQDEAEIVASLNHPNIIPIFEIGEHEHFYFQVMLLVKGTDLNSMINTYLNHPIPDKRVIPKKKALEIVIQVCDGLGYAHEQGVIHQDIKPANILIEERTQRPFIADFGISKAAEIGFKNNHECVSGTPIFISPEQAAGKETNKRSDIYSLGVVFFKMLAGQLPFRSESFEKVLMRKIENPSSFFTASPSSVSPHIDKELETIILKAIEPDSSKRYKDCYTFKEDCVKYLQKLIITEEHNQDELQ